MKLRIGTRRSRLALAQANEVAVALRRHGVETETVPMATSGDRGADPATDPAGSKGLFVAEIVGALRDGEIDVAVHSAKDLPAKDDEDLAIAAVPRRASALDVLVTASGGLPAGGRVGTSSVRRQAQVFRWRPDVLLKDVRGNVDTRLRKLAAGEYDAIVLAAAGLRRLGRADEIGVELDVTEFVPAAGQGLLALETRADDPARAVVEALNDRPARTRLEAERALVEEIDATCHTPVGAHARLEEGSLVLHAFVGLPDGSEWITDRLDGGTGDGRTTGTALAGRLLAAGAGELLRRAESTLGR